MNNFWTNKKEVGIFILFLVTLYGVFRYVLPLFLPFVIAFCIVAPTDRIVSKIANKTHISKGVLTGILSLFLFVIVFALFLLIILIGCNEIGNRLIQKENLMRQLRQYVQTFSSQWIPSAMNQSIGYMQRIVGIFVFLMITWISAVLLSKDFSQLKRWGSKNQYVLYAKNEIKQLGLFIRTFAFAQCLIIVGISFICSVGFLICGFTVGRAFLFGILTGILDAMPFLGTGLVLIPIAIWQLFLGRYSSAAIVFLLFLASITFRELLEPRLVGDKMGLWPVFMLMSVYVGVEVFGGIGLFFGPVYLIVATDFYRHAFEKPKMD